MARLDVDEHRTADTSLASQQLCFFSCTTNFLFQPPYSPLLQLQPCSNQRAKFKNLTYQFVAPLLIGLSFRGLSLACSGKMKHVECLCKVRSRKIDFACLVASDTSNRLTTYRSNHHTENVIYVQITYAHARTFQRLARTSEKA